jgi:hypothetical protein
MKLIAPEDICIRGEAIIQNSKWTRKLSLQPKWFAGLGSWAARGKEIRVFSAFCSRLRAGYVKRVETIRLSGVSNPKKKIASLRVSTISPVIASSRYPLLLRAPTTSRDVRGGAFLLVQITLVRPGVGKCTGGEAQSTPSLHCWFVCCNQLNSRFLPNLRPGLQSCNTTNLTV